MIDWTIALKQTIEPSISESPDHPITRFLLRRFVAATALIALIAYFNLYGGLGGKAPIQSDGYSYYVYLPSWFIYKDISLEALANEWYGGTYPLFTGLRRWPTTGRWLNLHPVGTAILEAPFFVVADALSWWSNMPRDGFSLYYEHAAGLAGLAYFVAGVAVLRRILTRHFTAGVALATLVCITWGTNLFHYGVFDAAFSHAFAFFEIAVWLWAIEAWWDRATTARSVGLGLIAALIVLTRHTNAIFLPVFPLFGVAGWLDVRSRVGDIRNRRGMLAIAVVVGAIALFPQLALYRWITGSWIVNAYDTHAASVGFRFGSPHVLQVLFSTQKGLFFWSPVLLLAVIGLFVGRGWVRGLRAAGIVVFAAQVYLVASWSEWQFGASYGHRAFTDGLALMAPFLAASFDRAAAHRPMQRIVAVAATAAVLLSIAQMIQYWNGILPLADTTWAQYRALFLKFR